ncbi:MAG: hypothetical protein GY757_02795, partial [bacterium]|nr:hypothetical protein [bacterium]
IRYQIDDKVKEGILKPGKNYVIRIKNVTGLKMKNKYIYHFKIKSDNYYCGYLEIPGDEDKRALGVNTHIGVVY